jgi:hypothetical protein
MNAPQPVWGVSLLQEQLERELREGRRAGAESDGTETEEDAKAESVSSRVLRVDAMDYPCVVAPWVQLFAPSRKNSRS